MKSKKKNLVILAFIIAGNIFLACHKDPTTTPAKAVQYNAVINTLSAFHQQYGAPIQNFTINATTGGSFKGAKGTKFFFHSKSFLNNANQVISGNVNIQIKEIYSPGDMILSNMPTTSNGRGLLSEGEFYIHCTQSNIPLHLDTGMTFNAHMPDADSTALYDSLLVFTGNNNDTTNTNNWVPAYNNYITYLPDSICVNSDSLTWCNADGYYSIFPFYQVTVNPVNSPSIAQTNIYMFVNGHHAIWGLSANGSQFNTPDDIPQGAPLTIVGIALATDGTVYSAFLPYTNPGSNQMVNLTFSSTTVSAFQTQLAALH